MARIQVLQPYIANQIAAGEVVDRPASIVKELVENAIDASATSISIEIRNGGIDYIRVADNGAGIPAEDCLLAFERHATSKISAQEDLGHIATLGFRGEALSSIAAVAQVELKTLASGEQVGSHVRIEGGDCKLHQKTGAAQGASLTVENLFFNVPARRKFLKSARTEGGNIGEYVAKLILARPDIAFHYRNNERTVYQSAGDGDLKNAIFCVYGAEVLPHIKPVMLDNGYIAIDGFVGTAEIARPHKRDQSFILNGRVIRSYQLASALQRAYDTRIMGGKHPFAVLQIRIANSEVDVNVHPAKLEVRFSQESRVYGAMLEACRRALGGQMIPELRWPDHRPANPDIPAVSSSGRTHPDIISHTPDSTGASIGLPPSVAVFEAGEPVGSITVKEAIYEIPQFHVPHAQQPQDQAQLRIEGAAEHAQEEQQQFPDAPFTLIGQVYHAYWIAQQGEDLYFIDQHAAHERRLYEQLMRRDGEEGGYQQLLTPEILQLSQPDYALLLDELDLLRSLGFGIEPFGPSTIRVFEVPVALADAPVGRILRESITQLRKEQRTGISELKKEAIIQSACKHAIKAGDPITEQEIAELLEHFREHGLPLTCPHGRPVLFKLSRRELEKMFKRIP